MSTKMPGVGMVMSAGTSHTLVTVSDVTTSRVLVKVMFAGVSPIVTLSDVLSAVQPGCVTSTTVTLAPTTAKIWPLVAEIVPSLCSAGVR